MSPEPQLTGLAKTFNSVTFTGRANVAKATYASMAVCEMSCHCKIYHLPSWCVLYLKSFFSGIILIVAAVKAKNYIKAQ